MVKFCAFPFLSSPGKFMPVAEKTFLWRRPMESSRTVFNDEFVIQRGTVALSPFWTLPKSSWSTADEIDG